MIPKVEALLYKYPRVVLSLKYYRKVILLTNYFQSNNYIKSCLS